MQHRGHRTLLDYGLVFEVPSSAKMGTIGHFLSPAATASSQTSTWISNALAVSSSELVQQVRLRARFRLDVQDCNSTYQECIGQERSMAVPPDCLRTHDRRWSLCSPVAEDGNSLGELGRLHVVRIAAETLVAPGGVHGIRTRTPQAAERRKMSILYARGVKRRGQRSLAEVRHPAGFRNAPDVRELSDAMCFEQPEKCLERSGRVADRKDTQWVGATRRHLEIRPARSRPLRARAVEAATDRWPDQQLAGGTPAA
jgi:hypothetical protein